MNLTPNNPPEGSAGFLHIDRRDLLLLGALVALALAVRFAFFQGIAYVDEFNYMRHAAESWKGRFDIGGVLYFHGTRPLIFMPVGAAFALFGVSETSALAWPLFASTATVVLVYLLGRMLQNRERAAYAAVFACFLPLMVQEATNLLAGVVINLVIGLSALSFIFADDSKRLRAPLMFIAGAGLGAMTMVGEVGLSFGCFFVAAVLFRRRFKILQYWPIVAGFMILIAISVWYYWAKTGNPAFKADLSRTILEMQPAPFIPLYYTKNLIKPFTAHAGIFYLAGLALLLDRRRDTRFLAAWFILTWLFIEFATTSLTEYRLMFKSVRHMSVLSIPGVLLAGVALARLREAATGSPGRPAVLPVALVTLVLAGAFASSAMTSARRIQGKLETRAPLQRVRAHVQEWRGSTVYVTHWLWNSRVGFDMGYDDPYFPSGFDPYHSVLLDTADPDSKNLYVQLLEAGQELAPGILLHDESLFEASLGIHSTGSVGIGEIPVVLANPPAEWRRIDRIPMPGDGAVVIYEIPEGARWPAGGSE
jgi:hypothetical protein